MLYREIIAVCSEIQTKHINTLCQQNVELVNVKPGGTYSDHWAVKGQGGLAVLTYALQRHNTLAVAYCLIKSSRHSFIQPQYDSRCSLRLVETERTVRSNRMIMIHDRTSSQVRYSACSQKVWLLANNPSYESPVVNSITWAQ